MADKQLKDLEKLTEIMDSTLFLTGSSQTNTANTADAAFLKANYFSGAFHRQKFIENFAPAQISEDNAPDVADHNNPHPALRYLQWDTEPTGADEDDKLVVATAGFQVFGLPSAGVPITAFSGGRWQNSVGIIPKLQNSDPNTPAGTLEAVFIKTSSRPAFPALQKCGPTSRMQQKLRSPPPEQKRRRGQQRGR